MDQMRNGLKATLDLSVAPTPAHHTHPSLPHKRLLSAHQIKPQILLLLASIKALAETPSKPISHDLGAQLKRVRHPPDYGGTEESHPRDLYRFVFSWLVWFSRYPISIWSPSELSVSMIRAAIFKQTAPLCVS